MVKVEKWENRIEKITPWKTLEGKRNASINSLT